MSRDKFIFAIIAAILAGYFFPAPALYSGVPNLGQITSVGVSLIFFFYGLKLAPEKLKRGLKNWRLHLVVQASTFLLFPLLVIPFYFITTSDHQQLIWTSIFFLAVMPSTVSSSVVMVSIARGNVPAAIFNASISGIIGIVLSPLWISLFVAASGTDADLRSVYFKLATEIIAPVILGLLLQRFFGKYAEKYSRYLTLFDKTVIALIIYKSFAESFSQNIFAGVSLTDLIIIAAAVITLFFIVYAFIGKISDLLGFDREDRITAQFCGTKKSLVHGTVFSKVIFGAMPSAGLILVPLMIFHAVQILLISYIAQRLSHDVSD